jgi:hypothetical protein
VGTSKYGCTQHTANGTVGVSFAGELTLEEHLVDVCGFDFVAGCFWRLACHLRQGWDGMVAVWTADWAGRNQRALEESKKRGVWFGCVLTTNGKGEDGEGGDDGA